MGSEVHAEAGSRIPERAEASGQYELEDGRNYIKIKGQWRYLCRAVDRDGQAIDFLLTARRDKQAALRFFRQAVRQHGLPLKVIIDKSGAITVALEAFQEATGHKIEIRQSQYLNNQIEQDHRAIKRIVRPMLGFKSFRSARTTFPRYRAHAYD